ncbi:hypothetical protein Tco_0132296 [Tanacetum coccineum]|uniref:Uncharacterized protein n=1 Tax=Tanacetum coccineum TaxID=301880 RepID=A0ABQ4XJ19_9ASTR
MLLNLGSLDLILGKKPDPTVLFWFQRFLNVGLVVVFAMEENRVSNMDLPSVADGNQKFLGLKLLRQLARRILNVNLGNCCHCSVTDNNDMSGAHRSNNNFAQPLLREQELEIGYVCLSEVSLMNHVLSIQQHREILRRWKCSTHLAIMAFASGVNELWTLLSMMLEAISGNRAFVQKIATMRRVSKES